MKIEISTKELKAALTLAKRAVGGRPTLPILGCARLVAEGDTVTITASDLEVAFHQCLDANVIEEGVITIPIKATLAGLYAKGTTVFYTKDGDVYSESGVMTYKIGVNMPDEFPPLTIPETWDSELVVSAVQLKTGIQYVMPAVSTEDKRPVLMSINWNQGKMISADGYKLAVFDLATSEVLPGGQHLNTLGRGVDQVRMALSAKAGDVTIRFDERWTTFAWDNITYMVTTLEGRFPAFDAITPKNYSSKMVVKRGVWLDALKQIKAASEDGYIKLRLDGLHLKDAHVALTPSESDVEDFANWVDVRYLVDVFSACGDDTLTIKQNGQDNPYKIETQDGIYVVMPASGKD